ncbi:MAG: RibD family protein, partial [Rhodobacterales bacterium]|nr:RibD family protein [Rhodobacterales bacterium]
VVLDSRLRLPPGSQLARTAATVPTWVLTAGEPEGMKRRLLEDLGVKVIPVAADGAGHVDPAAALTALGEAGLTRLLVEAGAAVNGALLGAGLVDRLAWFRGGQVIGADGLAAVAACRVDALEGAPAFTLVEERGAGPDRFALYNKKE